MGLGEDTPRQLFAVAHRNPMHPIPETNDLSERSIEVFDGASDEQLRNAYEERIRSHAPGGSWEEPFLVLDERSVHDHTVVIHQKSSLGADLDEDNPEMIWYAWRVRIPEAGNMLTHLVVTPEIEDVVYLGLKDRFTGDDGIFRAFDAERFSGYRTPEETPNEEKSAVAKK